MADATIIQAHTVIAGRLSGDTSLVVHGRIEGSVEVTQAITIAPGGYIEGDLIADEIIVEGAVQGDLTAHSRVLLTASGRALANISSPVLEMADGAQVSGELSVGVDGAAPARTERIPVASRTRTTSTAATATAPPRSTAPAAPTAPAAEATAQAATTVIVVEEVEDVEESSEDPLLTEDVDELREDFTVKELRDELRRRDLMVSGTKDELIERLLQAQAEESG